MRGIKLGGKLRLAGSLVIAVTLTLTWCIFRMSYSRDDKSVASFVTRLEDLKEPTDIKAINVFRKTAAHDDVIAIRRSSEDGAIMIADVDEKTATTRAATADDGGHVMDFKLSIPHRVHFSWDSPEIPADLGSFVRSWAVLNPHWEFWFWSNEDVERLVRQEYPEVLDTYHSYTYSIERADVMRYVVLHRYGGVYADLDVECLRSFDELVDHHECVLGDESYEHAFVLFERPQANVINALMACRAGHPLFERLIAALPSAYKEHRSDVLRATGPWFLDEVMRRYLNDTAGTQGAAGVTVFDADHFMPTFDAGQYNKITERCRTLLASTPVQGGTATINAASERLLWTCRRLAAKSYENLVNAESYTNHHWVHTFLNVAGWRQKPSVSVYGLLPGIKRYGIKNTSGIPRIARTSRSSQP